LCEITSSNGIHIYFPEAIEVFGFEQKYWRMDGFGEKKSWMSGFAPTSGLIPNNTKQKM